MRYLFLRQYCLSFLQKIFQLQKVVKTIASELNATALIKMDVKSY